MKRISYLLLFILFIATSLSAQVQVNDSISLSLDSLLMELPEVMIKGERPIVKAEEGKLVYDLPRLVSTMPVNNAYDAIKELPGVVDMNDGLTLAGNEVNVIINGKVSTLTNAQLNNLLKSIPVSSIEKAEVMYAAPARYQVRGSVINLVLKSADSNNRSDTPKLQGELYTAWQQKHYESFTERASLLYSSSKFSADFLYSYKHGRSWSGIDKEALHTVNGTVHPMSLSDISDSQSNVHDMRLGMDYRITHKNILSMVYTTQFYNSHGGGWTTGTQQSTTYGKSENQLHNIKLDYQSSFGLSAGSEFTFYGAPGNQELHSVLNSENIDARYDDEQRINKWRFYLTQEHLLKKGWRLNYGTNYITAVDNSFQYYYDAETNEFRPENSIKNRREEFTWNNFVGVSKKINSKLSADASFAGELYHSDLWHDWTFYPTLNLNYIPGPGHILQFAFSSNRKYPAFWSLNNSISYLSAYSEIHGNPSLKPSTRYQANLTYILKGKYVFSTYYSYEPDYAVQTLYQHTGKLVEIYKVLNFDYRKQFGVQATAPFKWNNILNSRVTLVGYYMREKNNEFWDIPFSRNKASFIATMSNTFTLSTKPDIRLNISGFYQNGAIQGLYDIRHFGNVDASLRWTFARNKACLTLKGVDLFDTAGITTVMNYKGQNVTNRLTNPTRAAELSFSYKFGKYKEKKREEVDTSRFK